MPRASRLIALVLSLVLTNLTLVSSGYACTMSEGGSGGTMAGMRMGIGETAPRDAGSKTPNSPSSQHLPHHAPCRFPWAPDGCQSMAPCAPAALTSTSTPLISPAEVPPRVVTIDVIRPVSETRAPEIPPPRA